MRAIIALLKAIACAPFMVFAIGIMITARAENPPVQEKSAKDTEIQASIQKYLNERDWKRPVPIHSKEIIAYGKEAVPYVLPLLNKEDIFIRTDAAKILGEIGDERALPALAKSMVGGPLDKDVIGGGMRQACYDALLKFGESSRTYFETFSKSDDSGLRFLGQKGLDALNEKSNEAKKQTTE